jgi:hypothetical protein
VTALVIGATVLGVAGLAWDAWRRTLATRVEERNAAREDAIASLRAEVEHLAKRVQHNEDRSGGRR